MAFVQKQQPEEAAKAAERFQTPFFDQFADKVREQVRAEREALQDTAFTDALTASFYEWLAERPAESVATDFWLFLTTEHNRNEPNESWFPGMSDREMRGEWQELMRQFEDPQLAQRVFDDLGFGRQSVVAVLEDFYAYWQQHASEGGDMVGAFLGQYVQDHPRDFEGADTRALEELIGKFYDWTCDANLVIEFMESEGLRDAERMAGERGLALWAEFGISYQAGIDGNGRPVFQLGMDDGIVDNYLASLDYNLYTGIYRPGTDERATSATVYEVPLANDSVAAEMLARLFNESIGYNGPANISHVSYTSVTAGGRLPIYADEMSGVAEWVSGIDFAFRAQSK